MAQQEPMPKRRDALQDLPEKMRPVAGDGMTPPDQATEGLADANPHEVAPDRSKDKEPAGSRQDSQPSPSPRPKP